jgi:peptide/nickel transport system permease protein
MKKYLLKRLVYLILVFLAVSFIMYMVYNLVPNDPARAELEPRRRELGKNYQTEYEKLREQMGLNDPLLVRYCRWFGFMPEKNGNFNGILQGNFGYSNQYKRDVVKVIGTPMSNSIQLNLYSTIITLAITIPLGIYCAVHARSTADNVIQVGTVIGYSLPTFLVAILFIYLFAVLIPIFPTQGARTAGSTMTGIVDYFDRLYYMALPILAMVFTGLAGMTRTVRAAMMDTLSQDYIRTARAKGLKEKVVIYSHAWRNALLPVSTSIMGWMIGVFTGGSLVIENTFGLTGTGSIYITALDNKDFELALALQLFYTLVGLFGVLLTDISYTLVDPRVRIDK